MPMPHAGALGPVGAAVSVPGPVLKFPGGKPRQAARIVGLFDPTKRLIEPFMGAGSVTLCAAARGMAVLASDVDPDIVHFHAAVGAFPDTVYDEAAALSSRPCAGYYAAIREAFNAGACPHPANPSASRAGMLLWLNRAGYNGLYRRNRSGGYNVSWGKREVSLPPRDRLRSASKALSTTHIVAAQDFAAALAHAGEGDVVYLDPPYLPLKAGGFTAYSGTPFGEDEHARLHDHARAARDRGADVYLSNHTVEATFRLYPTFELALAIEEKRTINRNGDDREPVVEAVLRAI